jgi:hypothetical protein
MENRKYLALGGLTKNMLFVEFGVKYLLTDFYVQEDTVWLIDEYGDKHNILNCSKYE